MYARLRPNRSPILLPIRMNAAETSASSAIADCTPLAVVSRSWTTAEIETFISDVSTTSTNIAIASRIATSLSPLDSAGAATVESTAMAVTLALAQDGRIIPSALGGQLLGDPALARAREPDALVQAVVEVLPELDRVRLEHVAAPPLGLGTSSPGRSRWNSA